MKITFKLLLLSLVTATAIAQKDSTKVDTTRTIGIATASEQYKQYLPNYNPTSPNLSGFSKYGENQANLSTGVLQETIPLYTIKVGELEVPISLTCDLSGHRMSERASFVGWGWSLNSGGAVSRQVKGLPDDQGGAGYIQSPVVQNRDLCNSATDYNYAKNVRDNLKDPEPDVFSFSYPSGGGRFLLGHTGQNPMIIPWMPIQVNSILNASSIITGFDIIDPLGKQYRYGSNAAYEQTTEINGRWSKSYSHNYLLTELYSPNTDDQIIWTYQSGGSHSQEEKQHSVSMIGQSAGTSPLHFTNSQVEDVIISNVSNATTFKVPDKITYANGEIDFSYNTATREDMTGANYLKEIHIYTYIDGIKTLLRTVELHHSYFKNALNQNARLKLDSLSFKDANGTSIEKYLFDYHSNSFSWVDNDSYRNKQDFFGYYNAKNNQSLITLSSYNTGSYTVPITGGGADRSTVSTYLKQGVLQKITYPTKGYTTYDLEPHQYYDGTQNTLAGGLRIKQIKSYIADGSLALQKRYEYSIGKLPTNWLPASVIIPKINYLWWATAAPAGSSGRATQFHFNSNGPQEQGTFDAAAMYYARVKEYFEETGAAQSNGRNEYDFSFVSDQITNTPTSKQLSIQPWKRGNLLEKRTYNQSNALVAKETHSYTGLNESSQTKGAFVGSQNVFSGIYTAVQECSSGIIGKVGSPYEVTHSTFSYQTGQRKPSSSAFLKDNVSSSQTFSYDLNTLPILSSTQNAYPSLSRNSSTTYPTHSSYAADPIALEMVNRNMLAIPLEQKQTEGGETIYHQKNVYDLFPGSNPRMFVFNVLPKQAWVDLTGNGLEKRIDYLHYDLDGNITEYKVDGKPTALAYAYTNELPITIAENSSSSALSSAFSAAGKSETDFQTSDFNLSQRNAISSIQAQLPNAYLSWYAPIPQVGSAAVVSPQGLLKTFDYDSFQRLRRINDHSDKIEDLYEYQYSDGSSLPDIPSNLQWDISRNSCSNTDGVNAVFQVFVTGIGTAASVEFSIDNTNWYAANIGLDGYSVSVPYAGGGGQGFWARPSDNPTSGLISGVLSKCAYTGGPPAAPTLSVGSSTLCSVTLTASGCSGTIAWSNASSGASINVATGNSTSYTATCSDANGTSGNSNSLSIPVLPSTWSAAAIGVTNSCSQEASNNWTLKSDGGIGTAAANDDFQYVYKQVTGDFTFIVNLASITSTDGNRSGIMLRNSLDPKAVDFTIFQDGNSYVGIYKRDTQNGNNDFVGFAQGVVNQTWLKLVRVGNNLSYYYSTNGGSTWSSSFSLSPPFPASMSLNSTVYLGLATWGGLHEATFSNLTLTTP